MVLLGIDTATSLRGGNDEYRLLAANLLSMTCSYRRRIRYYEFAEKPLEAATGFPRRHEPVEKVGVELIATTNRAQKRPKTGVFGTRTGAKANTKGVFQQPGSLSAVRE